MNGRSKILILDASSYVGGHLFNRIGGHKAIGTYFKSPVLGCVYFDALSMDLRDVVENPNELTHAVILYADTKPDSCAADINKSRTLNVESIKRVVERLNEWNIKPVFTSTESVFDGVTGDYVESDTPNPILVYGQQKLEIEEFLEANCPRFTVVRLAKVFGSQPGDSTIFTTWIDAIKRSDDIVCAYDQVFSPIHVDDVVESIYRLINLDCDGIYHVANQSSFSRIQLLNILITQLKKEVDVRARVHTCSIHDFDLSERRPLNVSMNPRKLIDYTGVHIQSIEDSVCDLVTNIKFD